MSVEPLYPQVCQKKDVYNKPSTCLGPIDISRELNSMACSLSVKREDLISFYHLILEARHFVATLWSSGESLKHVFENFRIGHRLVQTNVT